MIYKQKTQYIVENFFKIDVFPYMLEKTVIIFKVDKLI